MTTELQPDQVAAIHAALMEGQKIQAIRIYREATGQGLKESKDFIDALSSRLAVEDPERFGQPTSNSAGCAVLAALLLLGTGFALFLLVA